MDLLAAVDALADALTAAGVPASAERSKVQTPGAWVASQHITDLTLNGGGTATVDVILVVGDTGDRPSLRALSGLLTTVLGMDLSVSGPVDTSYALVLTGPPLPAFRVPVAIDL